MRLDILLGETESNYATGLSVLRLQTDDDAPSQVAWLTVHESPFGLTKDQARYLGQRLVAWSKA